ncbi:MAG: alcohol dehydrogenase catalytic domain-containing protein [Sandaracinaceae bacterium]
MKALRFVDGAPVLAEVDPPEPRPGEALIRLKRAGICSTDLHITRGYMAFEGTLGHEFVGEVVGGDDPTWIGRRVVGEINLSCGQCERCRRDMGRHCARRTVLGILGKDGCFAELLTLPYANLHPVPDALDDELAAFTEPLAAAFEVLEQCAPPPDARVAVLGDGKLGSLVAQVLRLSGADVTLVGRHRRKLAIAAALGIRTATHDAEVAGDFDLVVEATGSPEGFARARELVRPRGTLVLKSTFHGATPIDTAPLVIDEITLVGSRCGPFPPALRTLGAGAIDPRPLIDDRFDLADGLRALERAAERGVAKVQLVAG